VNARTRNFMLDLGKQGIIIAILVGLAFVVFNFAGR